MVITLPRIFLEADSGAPPGGDNPPAGEPQNETVAKAEYEKIVSANNWAQGRVRKLEEQLKEVSDQLSALKSGSGDDNGKKKVDVDALLKRVSDLEKERDDTRRQMERGKVKETVRGKLGEHLAQGTFDFYWAAEGEKFVLAEVDGKETVQFAPAPYMTWDQIAENLPAPMKASKKAPGAGVPNPSKEVSGGGLISPAQYQSMSAPERQRYIAEHPELWQANLDKAFK